MALHLVLWTGVTNGLVAPPLCCGRALPVRPRIASLSAAETLPATLWSISQLVRSARSGAVSDVTIRNSGVFATGSEDGQQYFVQLLPQQIESLTDSLINTDVNLSVDMHTSVLASLANLFPWLLLGYIALNFSNRFQQLGLAQKQNVDIQGETNITTTFDDVAGSASVKRELMEIVDFLDSPDKFAKVGARIPKGVIMEGPPGTGKTLLARALAGEAKCALFPVSGSAFVEMFVGLGALRVRDLFRRARENAPCIIFIDEIDAIGKKRASNPSSFGGNDEREQTLNQILSEMDGFSQTEGVIVVAATNRIDILDDALLRPGRFDRKVTVGLPDAQARASICMVHMRGKPFESEVDPDRIARITPGFSGAQLENIINEAAIYATRANADHISMKNIEEAIDRVLLGLPLPLSDNTDVQSLVAYHEAGHALVGFLSESYDRVGKVTILPRSSGAAGVTQFVPDDVRAESGLYTREYMESAIRVALGGRVAEEIVFGAAATTTGAASDLARVRDIAYRMVTEWGFGPASPVPWDQSMRRSPDTQQGVEDAVEEIVAVAREDVLDVMVRNRGLLNDIAELLLAKKTVGEDDIAALAQGATDV